MTASRLWNKFISRFLHFPAYKLLCLSRSEAPNRHPTFLHLNFLSWKLLWNVETNYLSKWSCCLLKPTSRWPVKIRPRLMDPYISHIAFDVSFLLAARLCYFALKQKHAKSSSAPCCFVANLQFHICKYTHSGQLLYDFCRDSWYQLVS